MSDSPSNAASDWSRDVMAYTNEHGPPSYELARASMTDDFAYEDRRHHGPNFGRWDATSAPKALMAIWDTGGGQPHFSMHEVVAIRGDRIAACRTSTEYPNGWTTESIQVLELDAGLRLMRRMFDFDVDDVDAAIAEVDRLHSEADTS